MHICGSGFYTTQASLRHLCRQYFKSTFTLTAVEWCVMRCWCLLELCRAPADLRGQAFSLFIVVGVPSCGCQRKQGCGWGWGLCFSLEDFSSKPDWAHAGQPADKDGAEASAFVIQSKWRWPKAFSHSRRFGKHTGSSLIPCVTFLHPISVPQSGLFSDLQTWTPAVRALPPLDLWSTSPISICSHVAAAHPEGSLMSSCVFDPTIYHFFTLSAQSYITAFVNKRIIWDLLCCAAVWQTMGQQFEGTLSMLDLVAVVTYSYLLLTPDVNIHANYLLYTWVPKNANQEFPSNAASVYCLEQDSSWLNCDMKLVILIWVVPTCWCNQQLESSDRQSILQPTR